MNKFVDELRKTQETNKVVGDVYKQFKKGMYRTCRKAAEAGLGSTTVTTVFTGFSAERYFDTLSKLIAELCEKEGLSLDSFYYDNSEGDNIVSIFATLSW